MEEKLRQLGYSILTCGNIVMGEKRLHDYNFYIEIVLINGKLYDYYMPDLVVRNQSDIDNIQTAYSVLQSDLKGLENEDWWKSK